MIARNLQELADAVELVEMQMQGWGVQNSGYTPRRLRLAEVFAEDLILVSNHDQARQLIEAHPRKAEAFFSILHSVRVELEEAGVETGEIEAVPLLRYAPVADAVSEAVRAYRKHQPYIPLLLAQLSASRGESSSRRRGA
jgi:hypothetical protein